MMVCAKRIRYAAGRMWGERSAKAPVSSPISLCRAKRMKSSSIHVQILC